MNFYLLIVAVLLPYLIGCILPNRRWLIIYAALILLVAVWLPFTVDMFSWEEMADKHHGAVFAHGAITVGMLMVVGGGLASVLMRSIILAKNISLRWQQAALSIAGLGVAGVLGIAYIYAIGFFMH